MRKGDGDVGKEGGEGSEVPRQVTSGKLGRNLTE